MPSKSFLTLAALLFFNACSAIDNAFDCNTICNRYKSCFNSKYDVAACAGRCRADSQADRDYQRKADTCTACIDDQSCAAATFNCAASCGSIVP